MVEFIIRKNFYCSSLVHFSVKIVLSTYFTFIKSGKKVRLHLCSNFRGVKVTGDVTKQKLDETHRIQIKNLTSIRCIRLRFFEIIVKLFWFRFIWIKIVIHVCWTCLPWRRICERCLEWGPFEKSILLEISRGSRNNCGHKSEFFS